MIYDDILIRKFILKHKNNEKAILHHPFINTIINNFPFFLLYSPLSTKSRKLSSWSEMGTA
jgi:hypothetical protein